MNSKFFHIAGIALMTLGGVVRADVLLDFNTDGQYAANFRKWTGSGGYTSTYQTPGSGYVSVDNSSSLGSAVGMLFDTTPSTTNNFDTFAVSASAPIKLSINYATEPPATSGSSVGFYLIDPTNTSKTLLVLFNSNLSGTTDAIRFFIDAQLDSSSVGTQLTDASQTSSQANIAPLAGKALTVIFDGTTLTATIGTLSFTYQVDAAHQFSSVGVALRLADQDYSTGNGHMENYDNFTITTVPEAASLSLLGLGSVVLMSRKR